MPCLMASSKVRLAEAISSLRISPASSIVVRFRRGALRPSSLMLSTASDTPAVMLSAMVGVAATPSAVFLTNPATFSAVFCARLAAPLPMPKTSPRVPSFRIPELPSSTMSVTPASTPAATPFTPFLTPAPAQSASPSSSRRPSRSSFLLRWLAAAAARSAKRASSASMNSAHSSAFPRLHSNSVSLSTHCWLSSPSSVSKNTSVVMFLRENTFSPPISGSVQTVTLAGKMRHRPKASRHMPPSRLKTISTVLYRTTKHSLHSERTGSEGESGSGRGAPLSSSGTCSWSAFSSASGVVLVR